MKVHPMRTSKSPFQLKHRLLLFCFLSFTLAFGGNAAQMYAKSPAEKQLLGLGAVVHHTRTTAGDRVFCGVFDRDKRPVDVESIWSGEASDLGLITHLDSLNFLAVCVERVKPSDLRFVRELNGLEVLRVDFRFFASSDLQYVENPSITSLWLDNTSVGDGIIQHLSAFPQLEVVLLRNTRTTQQGARQMRERFPRTEFVLDGDEFE